MSGRAILHALVGGEINPERLADPDPRSVWRESFAAGAQTQQMLASVVRTAQQRPLDPHAVLVSMLRARTPIVSVALRDRTQ